MDAILSLVRTWIDRPSYSHGFLIPFISLYVIYSNRDKLVQFSIKPNIWGGLLLTITACLMLLIGKISSVEILLRMSILFIIPGVLLMLLGTNYLRKLVFPLAYLIFMVPVMDIFLTRLHWPSQVISAKMASWILNFLTIPVVRETNILHLPNISVEVAEVCSGVRFFVSILALGIPLAYFTQKQLWRKVVLIISGIIIVIPVNSLRIAFIGLWAYRDGEILHGPHHIFQGLFVAIAGFVILIILAYFLNKIPSKSVEETETRIENSRSKLFNNTKDLNKPWLIAILLLIVTASCLHLYEPIPVKLNQDSITLPDKVGAWKADSTDYNKKFFSIDRADVEVIQSYKDSANRRIKVYVGYFESRGQNKELINYRLDWLYKNAQEIEVPLMTKGSVRVNRTIFKDGIDDSLALYWYDLNGRIIADNIMAKTITAIDAVIKRRTNGAIIIVSSSLNNRSNSELVLKDEIEFVQAFLPLLPKYFSLRGKP